MTSKEALEEIKKSKTIIVGLEKLPLKSGSWNKEAIECFNIIEKDLEVLELLKAKQVDIHHLVSLCRCCGYESGLNAYNSIPANKEITLKELETIKEWLENE